MKKYLYETHLHTAPVSRCAASTVREALEFYKEQGYAGVFITNHFIDGNMNCDKHLPYAEKIEFYFSDYEEGARIGCEIGLPVFLGVESSYKGSDFLIYGLGKEWFLAHPEIEGMKKSEFLTLAMQSGALIIHAHPFCEAPYIDHIRLYPRHVHGVEIYNSSRSEFYNRLAEQYAQNYDLIPFAGSDNHNVKKRTHLGGMSADTPIEDIQDFISRFKNRELEVFHLDLD